MKPSELRRWLVKQGCTIMPHRSGSGHVTVIRGNRRSQLPMRGSGKDLGPPPCRENQKGPRPWL